MQGSITRINRPIIRQSCFPRHQATQLKRPTKPGQAAVIGWNHDFAYYNCQLSNSRFLRAANDYLKDQGRQVDNIEISNQIPGLGIVERFNPVTSRVESHFLIPQRILQIDTDLYKIGQTAEFSLSVVDEKAVISWERVQSLLASLPEKCADSFLLPEYSQRNLLALQMHCGLHEPGRYYTLNEIGAPEAKGRATISLRVKKAIKLLRRPYPKQIIETMQQSTIAVINWLFKGDAIVTLAELKTALVSLNLLKEEDKDMLVPLLYFMQRVTGQPLAEYYINLETGKQTVNITDPNAVLCRDPKICEKIFSLYFEYRSGSQKRVVWQIDEFRTLLKIKHDIVISHDKLRHILDTSNKFTVEGNQFYRSEGIGLSWDKNLQQIIQAIKEKGRGLHYLKIAQKTGIKAAIAHPLLQKHGAFVLIGKGIYDLQENFPQLKDIPWPNVRRKSGVFAAVYFVLREAGHPLTRLEIHQRMEQKGFRWSYAAVCLILNNENYNNLVIEKDGKYTLNS